MLLLNNFSIHNICQLNSHYETLLFTIYTLHNELSLQLSMHTSAVYYHLVVTLVFTETINK